jgi:hypothetical protein
MMGSVSPAGRRVRVKMRQLKQWYRMLDQLLAHKSEIEHTLYLTSRDLFSLPVEMAFYDLTSTSPHLLSLMLDLLNTLSYPINIIFTHDFGVNTLFYFLRFPVTTQSHRPPAG